MLVSVYYRREPTFRPNPDISTQLNYDTYAHVKDIEVNELGDVFHAMQGEVWSPNGEARELIRSKGLHHTSMSVGDVAVTEAGKVFEVQPIGWKEIV